jgi:GT2 family glycosyltransferase
VDISVILATYRRPTLLARTLQAMEALRAEWLTGELLVVDNAGDPETQAVVSRVSGPLPIRLLVEPERGKSRALNRAVPEAQGRLVAFTDDDVAVDAGWLVELAAGADRWPDHAVFGGRVLPRWPAGRRPPADHPFLSHAYAIADWRRPEGPYDAGYVFGPNMAVRASVFRAGWRFDPQVGPDGSQRYVPGTETELLRRLEQAGLAAVYLPRAVVSHLIRPEQLETRWLFGRAFRKGRWDLRKESVLAVSQLGGLPRNLLHRAVRAYLRLAVARLAGDRHACLEHGLAYWHTRGMMYECRRLGSSRWP